MRHRPPRTEARRRAGLTLVELIIALAIMALIGLTVSAMLSAVAYGTDSGRDVRASIARGKMTTARIDAAIRESRAVLAASEGVLVLWMRDEDGDEIADADEVRRLEHDASAATLTSYRSTPFTEAQEDAGDDAECLKTLTLGIQQWPAAAADRLVTVRWASGVGTWQATLDAPAPAAARLVSYRLGLSAAEDAPVLIGVAALRNVTEEP